MNIACLCPIGIGNYLLVYPACHLLKKLLPDAHLHLIGLRPAITELAGGDPLWSDLTVFDALQALQDPLAAFSIVKKLRACRFDVSLNLFPSNTWHYHLLAWLTGSRTRRGFAYHYHPPHALSLLLTDRIPVDPALHDVEQNISLVTSLTGAAGTESVPPVFPVLYTTAESEWARTFVQILPGHRRILLHPGSSADHGMASKRWPPERFALLASRIATHLDAHVLIVGGPDEHPLKTAVHSRLGSVATIIAPVSLRRTAALAACCDLCLANDSGIMHLAACQAIPTIAIFGPTDERRNGPTGAGPCLVVRKPMAGFPLWNATTVGSRKLAAHIDPLASLLALSVEDAWEQIEPWLVEHFA